MENYSFTFSRTKHSHIISTRVIFLRQILSKSFSQIFQNNIFFLFLGWMAKTFFTGGTMPSHDLLLYFQNDLKLQKKWAVNGTHYSKTLEAWLERFDIRIQEIWPILEKTYGMPQIS